MRKKHILFVLALLFLANLKLCKGNLTSMPLETVISRRISIHYGNYYDLNAPVPSKHVSEVLWAAYGFSSQGRTVPSLFNYPVKIYVCNETAAYKFVPENQSLTLWKEGDYRGLGGAYPAPIQLFIAFDTNICADTHWGNVEAGCAIQSIYLMANSLNLGTVCTNDVVGVNQGLGLPNNEIAIYKMPLGYLLPPYTNYQNLVPTSRPSSLELPEVQDSVIPIDQALDSTFSSHNWSSSPVTRQELSQVLWASYGYSYYLDTATSPPKRHRTVPSAHSYYPMKIYAANSSGIYRYIPEQHTLSTILTEDRRVDIALASGNAWASSAPLIIAVAWDDTQISTVDMTYVEVGLITQNVFLESAAWGLISDWGKADANEDAMREALGLSGETHLHPASIITVGHPLIYFNLSIASTETGTTNPLPGIYTHQAGTSVNVTAIPNPGYSFDYWLLNEDNRTENPITVTMDTNHTLEAVFIDDIPPEISALIQDPTENITPYQNVTITINVTDEGSGLYNVTLWYSINNGTIWTPLNMTKITTNAYQTTIPGYEYCTWITYKIITYDNDGNQAIEDNYGYHYVYHVIPEFTSLTIVLLMIVTLLAVALYKRIVPTCLQAIACAPGTGD
jgi:hypothetical protein